MKCKGCIHGHFQEARDHSIYWCGVTGLYHSGKHECIIAGVQTEQDAADLELGRALRASLDDGLSLFCRDGKWYTSHECEDACGCDGSYDTPTEALSHMWDGTYIMQLGRMLGAEIERSRAQFPGSAHMLAALLEETGEVARALLEGNRPHLREECLHVAATAMRIHEEGDADFTQEARDE